MSERPEADKAVGPATQTTPTSTGAATAHPTTVEKGQEGQPTKTDKPDKPDKPPPGRTVPPGGTVYDDDYIMGRDESGAVWLTDPEGTKAFWRWEDEVWVNEHGNPMPPEWAGGHAPRQAPPVQGSKPSEKTFPKD